MNKNRAEMNKGIQSLLRKEMTFREGMDTLPELRNDLFAQITSIVGG